MRGLPTLVKILAFTSCALAQPTEFKPCGVGTNPSQDGLGVGAIQDTYDKFEGASDTPETSDWYGQRRTDKNYTLQECMKAARAGAGIYYSTHTQIPSLQGWCMEIAPYTVFLVRNAKNTNAWKYDDPDGATYLPKVDQTFLGYDGEYLYADEVYGKAMTLSKEDCFLYAPPGYGVYVTHKNEQCRYIDPKYFSMIAEAGGRFDTSTRNPWIGKGARDTEGPNGPGSGTTYIRKRMQDQFMLSKDRYTTWSPDFSSACPNGMADWEDFKEIMFSSGDVMKVFNASGGIDKVFVKKNGSIFADPDGSIPFFFDAKPVSSNDTNPMIDYKGNRIVGYYNLRRHDNTAAGFQGHALCRVVSQKLCAAVCTSDQTKCFPDVVNASGHKQRFTEVCLNAGESCPTSEPCEECYTPARAEDKMPSVHTCLVQGERCSLPSWRRCGSGKYTCFQHIRSPEGDLLETKESCVSDLSECTCGAHDLSTACPFTGNAWRGPSDLYFECMPKSWERCPLQICKYHFEDICWEDAYDQNGMWVNSSYRCGSGESQTYCGCDRDNAKRYHHKAPLSQQSNYVRCNPPKAHQLLTPAQTPAPTPAPKPAPTAAPTPAPKPAPTPMTCRDASKAHKSSGCCGNPNAMFFMPNSRRLAGDEERVADDKSFAECKINASRLANEIETALQNAEKADAHPEVLQLARKLREVVQGHVQ